MWQTFLAARGGRTPDNFGALDNADGHARITGPCGDTMEYWVQVREDRIVRANFTTDGCMTSVAAGCAAAHWAERKTIEAASRVSQEDILRVVGGLPEESSHCALLAANTLRASVEDYLMRTATDCGECPQHDCTSKQKIEGESAKEFTERQELQRRMCKIRHKIVVLSGKGGVGKSTVAVNLAAALSLKGWRAGLLDVDIHGPSVPKMLHLEGAQIETEDGVILPVEIGDLKIMSIGFLLPRGDEAVVWRGPMKMGVIQQFLKDVAWGDLDVLVVDCPPGTGDEPLSVAQLIPDADGAVVVTTPQDVAILDVRRSVSFCRQVNLPVLGVVENMSGFTCPKCGEVVAIFKEKGGELMAEEMGVPFLGRIPIDPELVTACDAGQVYMHHKTGRPGVAAFAEVTQAIVDALSKPKEK